MTDEKYLFIQDSKDKKNVARSASKKNRTGKGPVKFPSDYLTRKQKEALNGEMVTYSMNKRVDWGTFRSWPHDIQQEYVDGLVNKYGIGFSNLVDVFSAKYQTVYAYFVSHNISCPRTDQGHKKKGSDEWLIFLGKTENEVAKEPQPAKKVEEQITTREPRSTDILKRGTLTFEGSPIDICIELERMLGDKRRKFDISFYEIVEDVSFNAFCGSEE